MLAMITIVQRPLDEVVEAWSRKLGRVIFGRINHYCSYAVGSA